MDVRQGAAPRIRNKVRTKPLLLSRSGMAAAHRGAIAVQGDEVPVTDIEAVIALVTVARGTAEAPDPVEVVEVALSTSSGVGVLVVPHHRPGPGFQPPPRGVITSGVWPSWSSVVEIIQLPFLVLRISERKNNCGIHLYQQIRYLEFLAGLRNR